MGLEVLIEGENSIDEQMSITTEKSMEPREEAEQTVFEIVDDIIVEQIPAQIQESEGWKCDECPYETKMKKQMETHRRIKHVDVIKFGCNKCDFNSSTKRSLDTHEMSHQEEVHSCNECDFVT